jgi:hypothetical protein
MNKEKIRQYNSAQFLVDIKAATACVVIAKRTRSYMRVSKTEVLQTAENQKIIYYLSDTVFVSKQIAMIIM